MLGQMEKAKGAAKKGWKTQRHAVTTLSEIGIQKKQSERWQSIAALPKKDFEGYIQDNRQGQKEITTAGALKLARLGEEGRPVQDSDFSLVVLGT